MYKPFFYQCMRFFLVVTGLLITYVFLKYMFLFFYPFLFALLFSFMMNPIVTSIEKKLKVPRMFATFTVVCIFFMIISSLSVLIITELIQGTTFLAIEIPKHFQSFVEYIDILLTNKLIPLYEQLTSFFHTLNQTQQITITDQIQQLITKVATFGTSFLSHALLKIPSILSMIPYSIAMFIFTLMATFFITNDWQRLKSISQRVIPVRLKYTSENLLIHLGAAFFGFFKAQFILISISACITMIGLLVLQVNHAITITLLIAFVDLLPVLGTGIIFIPWIGYLFLMGNYPLTIGLAILYMIIIISRQIFEPRILAVNIGVNPLIALLTLFISIQFWGIAGVIIAPLLLIFINVFYKSGLIWKFWKFIKGSQS